MILDEIIAHKRVEVDAAQARLPLTELKARLAGAPPPRGFETALRRPKGRMGLIAEIKKASPSAGVIAPDFDHVAIAKAYAAAGADCLSVLTDEKFFQGTLAYMREAREASGLPVLRKDFTVSEYQVYEARAHGADAILLIVAALSELEIDRFLGRGLNLGMSVLVETHTEAEMEVAVRSGATLIGINSRDLRTFKTDLAVVDSLAPLAGSALMVAESGIKTRADIDRLTASGVGAVLIGETLMRSADIGATVHDLIG